MGWAYSYCPKCHNGLPKATAQEIVDGKQRCRSCETLLAPNINRDQLLVDLERRIEELEERTSR